MKHSLHIRDLSRLRLIGLGQVPPASLALEEGSCPEADAIPGEAAMNELPNARKTKIQSITAKLLKATTVEPARDTADEAFAIEDSSLKMDLLAQAATINPFSVPRLPPNVQATAIFPVHAWAKSIAMARMVAANHRATRILVASAPKTGSTFLVGALQRAYKLNRVSLTMLSTEAYGHVQFGGRLRDHDVDELALLSTSYLPNGYVAHHHMIATPFLGEQVKLYGVTPIVTRRNLFDALVSYDEHIMRQRGKTHYLPYLHWGFPETWFDMEFDDRLDYLLDSQLPWYTRYYASWRLAEQEGHIDPLWIDYEKDVLGSKQALAQKLAERVEGSEASIRTVAKELSHDGYSSEQFNKGVAGRGAKITGKNRRKIEDFIHRFKIACDLTDLIES